MDIIVACNLKLPSCLRYLQNHMKYHTTRNISLAHASYYKEIYTAPPPKRVCNYITGILRSDLTNFYYVLFKIIHNILSVQLLKLGFHFT